jgi:hypothetical protein
VTPVPRVGDVLPQHLLRERKAIVALPDAHQWKRVMSTGARGTAALV